MIVNRCNIKKSMYFYPENSFAYFVINYLSLHKIQVIQPGNRGLQNIQSDYTAYLKISFNSGNY